MSHQQSIRYARALRIAMAVRHPRRGELAEFSRRCGYSRVHVSQVLASRRAPSERFLAQACSALGCTRGLLDALAHDGASGDPLLDWLRGAWA